MDQRLSPKLSNKQKRAAKLLAYGYKTSKIAKILNINRITVWNWSKLPRFITRMKKYEQEFDTYIDTKQKRLLDKTFARLNRLLDSSHRDSVQFAIETILRVNNRNPESKTKVFHTGEIEQKLSGEVKINKKLKPEQKKNLKQLLDATRELVSPN